MAKPTVHVLYVPGVGARRPGFQRAAVWLWRFHGVKPELVNMHWTVDEPWEVKLGRLLARVDQLHQAGAAVALVGPSAGGAAVIAAYARRQTVVTGCVLIAGKIHRPEAIGPKYRRENPALLAASQDCVASLETIDGAGRARILSLYSSGDTVVPCRDSHIDGARNQTVGRRGHILTIARQITFGAGSFIRVLRQA